MTPTKFTETDYVNLSNLFAGGDISKVSKAELERFAVMLSRPKAFEHFGASSFPQICETVRTLILVRISEEANREASRISTIALYISIVALAASLIQASAAIWQLAFPSPTQVYTPTTVPAYVAPSVPAPQAPEIPAPEGK